MRGRGGSVLLEALLAMTVFMAGTAALVLLMHRSLETLTMAELEGRLAPEVSGVPLRAAADGEGEAELESGVLRWRPSGDDGAGGWFEIEFHLPERDEPTLGWRLRAEGATR